MFIILAFLLPEDRKWLRFIWKNHNFQFTCHHQDLTSAPHIFTKLMKLRKLGIIVPCYLDDCIFIATSADHLRINVNYALHLFDSLGLTLNTQKPALEPTQAQGLLLLKYEVMLRNLSSYWYDCGF